MTTETKKSVPIIKKTEKLKAISKAISKENPIAKIIEPPKATSIVNKESVSEEANVASDVSEETNVDSDETNTTSNLMSQVSQIGIGSVSKILSENFNTGTNTSLMNKIKGNVISKVSILNKLFILLLGIIIIAVSSSGYYVKKN